MYMEHVDAYVLPVVFAHFLRGCMYIYMYIYISVRICMYICMHAWKDGKMEGWKDKRMDGGMDGWMDVVYVVYVCVFTGYVHAQVYVIVLCVDVYLHIQAFCCFVALPLSFPPP